MVGMVEPLPVISVVEFPIEEMSRRVCVSG